MQTVIKEYVYCIIQFTIQKVEIHRMQHKAKLIYPCKQPSIGYKELFQKDRYGEKGIFILFSVGEIFNSKKNNFAFKISAKQ